MALGSRRPIVRRPKQPRQFLRHDSVGLGLSSFEPGLAGVVLAHFALHRLKTFPPKGFAADRPALPKLLESFLVHFLKATALHVALKLLPAEVCPAQCHARPAGGRRAANAADTPEPRERVESCSTDTPGTDPPEPA